MSRMPARVASVRLGFVLAEALHLRRAYRPETPSGRTKSPFSYGWTQPAPRPARGKRVHGLRPSEPARYLRVAVARSCARACARCAHPGLDAVGLSRGEVPASVPLERLGALAEAMAVHVEPSLRNSLDATGIRRGAPRSPLRPGPAPGVAPCQRFGDTVRLRPRAPLAPPMMLQSGRPPARGRAECFSEHRPGSVPQAQRTENRKPESQPCQRESAGLARAVGNSARRDHNEVLRGRKAQGRGSRARSRRTMTSPGRAA